jgi:hypothetical protein
MINNLNLKKIQSKDKEEYKKVYSLFGCKIKQGETFDSIKVYPFERILPHKAAEEDQQSYSNRTYIEAENIVNNILDRLCWRYLIFGPNREGKEFQPPKFKRDNYNNNCIWINQPWKEESAGSLSSAYNLLWLVSHELGHAFTNKEITDLFGDEGKRKGALGIETIGNTFSKSKGKISPLTLVDALRALEWEHKATILQRSIIEKEYNMQLTQEEFLCEYQYNVAGSVLRIISGEFTTPGYLGVVPQATSMNADNMNELGREICRQAAREMNIDLKEKYG